VSAFPGKKMKIIEVIPFSKSAIKGFARSHPSVNVAVRNFPLTAPELARKLKVREGGDLMVHGATLADGSRVLILTETPH
ncbi:MAG: SAM-dependent methyltransferase, partial [Duncaniella sp.]|nr:SAM-dependent methyltransferase [Duncaniella sp.]